MSQHVHVIDIASVSAANMNTQQLIALRRSFELQCRKSKTEVQLEYGAESEDTAECFTMK